MASSPGVHRQAVLSLSAIWLTLLVLGSLFLVPKLLQEPAGITIDTEIKTGVHVVFVLINPSSKSRPEYVDDVKRARAAVREYADSHHFFLSTIGVSDHWDVDEGLAILRQFGPFEEIIVGRNWFNTGLRRYALDLGGPLAFPQVIVTLEEIQVRDRGWESKGVTEVARLVGKEQLKEWLTLRVPQNFLIDKVGSSFETEDEGHVMETGEAGFF